MLKDFFGYAEYQEIATYGSGYNITLTRNVDNAVLNEDQATKFGRIKINSMEWSEQHYTASLSNQALLSKHILSKSLTELQFVERSVFMKPVKTQNLWTCELSTQEGIIVPI